MIDDTSQEFINRHIGPSKEDQSKMLDYIGSNSLKQLIKDTVPENILLKNELNMAHSLSESEALKKLKLMLGNIKIIDNGELYSKYNEVEAAEYMKNEKIDIFIDLNMGNKNFTGYTMDLSKEYININSDYRS